MPLLQVADFGFARFLPQASMAETLCGSPLYMAPEILRYEKYDAKADLWSSGAVLYEMCTGRPPFRAQNHVELLRRIEKGEDRIKFPEDRPPTTQLDQPLPPPVAPVPDDLKLLIRGLLKRNPIERMPFDDFFAQSDLASRAGAVAALLPLPAAASAPTSAYTSAAASATLDPLPSPPPAEVEEGAFVKKRPALSPNLASPQFDRPPAHHRKASFPPKYIVGSTANSGEPINSAGHPDIKAKDYAVQITPDLSRTPR